jgi:hypothetical protein
MSKGGLRPGAGRKKDAEKSLALADKLATQLRMYQRAGLVKLAEKLPALLEAETELALGHVLLAKISEQSKARQFLIGLLSNISQANEEEGSPLDKLRQKWIVHGDVNVNTSSQDGGYPGDIGDNTIEGAGRDILVD